MKRTLHALATLLALTSVSYAQTIPGTVAFTARVSDAGVPVNGPRNFTFRLFDAPANGTAVWQETQNGVNVEQGLAYVDLGVVTSLDASVFDGATLYLEVTVAGTTLSPRLPVQSVPYAIRSDISNSADTLGSIAPADVVTVINGTGAATATRVGNTVTLNVSTAALQQRVSGTCADGSAIQTVNDNGTVECEPVGAGDITGVTAGNGLSGGATTGTAALTLMPCSDQQVMRYVAGTGWACATLSGGGSGDITTVTAGTGLTGGGTVGDLTLAVSFAGSGAATSAARSDHTHSGVYLPRGSTLSCAASEKVLGLDTATGNVVCATDALGTTSFTASGGENGTATTAARGDHTHDTAYVNNNTGPTAEAASVFVDGTIRTTGMVRMGSETVSNRGGAGLSYPGMVVRRIEATVATAGTVVASANEIRLARHDLQSGLKITSAAALTGNHTAVCTAVTGAGATLSVARVYTSGVIDDPLFTDAQDVRFVRCMFGFAYLAGHTTSVELIRHSADNWYVGHMISTQNQ